jgi:probable HAF family extracellular repeat protein
MTYLSDYKTIMRYQSNLHRSIVGLISIGLIACPAFRVSTGHAQAPPLHSYNLIDLGVLPAKKARISTPAAINEQAQVTGTSGMSSVDESAFLYDPKNNKGAMEDLGRNYGGISRGFGINGVGDVVGDSTFGTSEAISHAALFRNGKIADLGTLESGAYSRATGINASGQVVGFSSPQRDYGANRAFIWNASTGMKDIGTLGGAYAQAFGINDSGFVTGTSQIADSSRVPMTHAFIYPMTLRRNMVDLGTLGGNDSYGMAINLNNHVAGYSTINIERVHAFLHDGTKMRDLGSLGGIGGRELVTDQSVALGINIIDQVVGWSYLPIKQERGESRGMPLQQAAFVYDHGVMMDLNELIGPAAAKHYWLKAATAINNNGQIVAIAQDLSTNEVHAVLLTP